jgi:hypothetical protein
MKKIIPIFLIGVLVLSGLGAGAFSIKKTTTQQITTDEYDMVIIAPNKFSGNLQPLIDHKNSVGIQTFLKTTEDIYDDYEGRDEAEQIKYFIKSAIEEYNVNYVLLIGGRIFQLFRWYVPVRIVYLADGARYTEYTSDLYFADIYKNNGTEFDDWDSDQDGIIAEWGDDTFDLKPDIAVGRLPCRNKNDVQSIVNKIIEYETGSFEESWFNRFIVAGGDSLPGLGEPFPYEGEELCNIAVDFMDDFDAVKLFTSDNTLVDHNDFIDAWNPGCGFVLYSGRAGPKSLLTFDSNGLPITPLNSDQINQLENTGKYPVFVINGCLSGKFDVTILNFIKRFLNRPNIEPSDVAWDCIGWQIVKKEGAGAIASFAPTSQCWIGVGDTDNNSIPDIAEIASGFLSLEFIRVFAEGNVSVLGDIYTTTIENYVETFPVDTSKIDCKTVQEYGLIGDPSLKVGGYSQN